MLNIESFLRESETHTKNTKVVHDEFFEFNWDAVPLSDLDPGALYTLGEKLGDGTTSIVFKATHPIHGNVAVKRFRKQYTFHAKTEISKLRMVQGHPSFTRLYDFWEDKGYAYIAMELLEGELLYLCTEEQMTIQEIGLACIDILSGLNYLHNIGYIHFDLKPENIGYKWDGTRRVYKIIDLGSSFSMQEVQTRSFQEEMNSGTTELTTMQYRPFEAIHLDRTQRHNEKTDSWSFGCVLYEMWTGNQLFEKCSGSNTKQENEDELQLGLTTIESLQELQDADDNFIVKLLKNSIVRQVDKRMSAHQLRSMIEGLLFDV